MDELKQLLNLHLGDITLSLIGGILVGYIVSAVTGNSKIAKMTGLGAAIILFILTY